MVSRGEYFDKYNNLKTLWLIILSFALQTNPAAKCCTGGQHPSFLAEKTRQELRVRVASPECILLASLPFEYCRALGLMQLQTDRRL